MKYSIAVLFTLIFCFSTNILAQPKFKLNAGELIRRTFKINSLQPVMGCLSRGKFEIIKLAYDRVVDSKLANSLADYIVRSAVHSKVSDENGWKRVSHDICLLKPGLAKQTGGEADKINQCFTKNQQLVGVKKADFANLLLDSFCSAVRVLAIEKFTEEIKRKN